MTLSAAYAVRSMTIGMTAIIVNAMPIYIKCNECGNFYHDYDRDYDNYFKQCSEHENMKEWHDY